VVNYEDFLPSMMLDLPGCPDQIAIDEVRKAAIDLCKQSNIWKEDLIPMPLQDGLHTMDFDFDDNDNTGLISIEEAFHDDKELSITDTASMNRGAPWRTKTAISPDFIMIVQRVKFRIVPIPTALATGEILIHGILKPSQKSYEVPDFLYEEYADVIAAGAKKVLMMQPKKAWTNPKLAGYYTNRWNTGLVIAKGDARKDFNNEPLRAPLISII